MQASYIWMIHTRITHRMCVSLDVVVEVGGEMWGQKCGAAAFFRPHILSEEKWALSLKSGVPDKSVFTEEHSRIARSSLVVTSHMLAI